MFSRSAGVLLHMSSLPGPYGIGDLGPSAIDWIEWLAAAGCRIAAGPAETVAILTELGLADRSAAQAD